MTRGQWLSIGAALIAISLVPITAVRALSSADRLTGITASLSVDFPDEVSPVPTVTGPRGETALRNPAQGPNVGGTLDDPLAGFSRRPFDVFDIPEGGQYLDPLHADGAHYGVDYAHADDYLNGKPTYFHPIGPGYVTARSSCMLCFAEGNRHGQVALKAPKYNFGWGGLVVIETPYRPDVSLYVLYAHNARDFVSLGDYVTPDDIIGAVGNSGYSETFHLHVEVRYGEPGRFWNADFTQWEVRDRWLATPFANPATLIFPENHWAFTLELDNWAALQEHPEQIP